jgi:hypothetical protein
MIPIDLYAWILLVSRVVMVALTIDIIRKQISGFAVKATGRLRLLRRSLFAAAVILLVGSVYPIVFDIITIFGETGRAESVRIDSFIYMMNANITWLAVSFALWLTYWFADTAEDAVISVDKR